jgi:putative transposase
VCGWVLQIVKRYEDAQGFVLLPRRRVVERTLAWLSNYCYMSRGYEYWPETSESMVHVASIHVMLRHLAPCQAN